jgi:glutamyl-tRNA reductase
MQLQLVGCSHHSSSVEIRERLAFAPEQVQEALELLGKRFPEAEAVLLSTCNRVELYLAAEDFGAVGKQEAVQFLADFHNLDAADLADELFAYENDEAVRHLFRVSASLDSMVVGEAQILSQVKQAFALAAECESTGPFLRHLFDAANRLAKRVASETAINRKRVSIPSVAVVDYAKQLFETFHDKNVLVVGAGQMGEETLRYLCDEGAKNIVILNRSEEKAAALAETVNGVAESWERLAERTAWADLIVSTTGAREPIMTAEQFSEIDARRPDRLLFILDLAVPRDFEPDIRHFSNVYLYCIDDLRAACDANQKQREKELPKAERLLEEEVGRCLADWQHRVTGPTIQRLKQQAIAVKDEELQRLINKLGDVDARTQQEIEKSFERLVNKILHPPLQSLREHAAKESHHGLLNALRHLFQISD